MGAAVNATLLQSASSRKSANQFGLEIGGEFMQCPTNGGTVRFTGSSFEGEIVCPRMDLACCSNRNFCNNRGSCLNGACVCNQGFTGDSCEQVAHGPRRSVPSRRSWPQSRFAVDEVI